jgi:UPF0716 protein FxsA
MAGWLLLEIWLLMTVAEAAGGLTVLALLVAGVVLGAMAVKRAGRSAWRGLAAASRGSASGSEPSGGEADSAAARTEPGNAALAMLGGLLLMLPGLVSDVAGLLCLFPPTRALLGRVLLRALDRRGASQKAGSLGDLLSRARMRRPDGKIVQGEVVQDGGTATEASGPTAEPDRRPDKRRDPGPQR